MKDWFNSLGYYQKGDVLIVGFVALFIAGTMIPITLQKSMQHFK